MNQIYPTLHLNPDFKYYLHINTQTEYNINRYSPTSVVSNPTCIHYTGEAQNNNKTFLYQLALRMDTTLLQTNKQWYYGKFNCK